MIWFVLALLTAFSESLKDIASKYNLKSVDPYIVAWATVALSLPLLLPLLLIVEIPPLNWQFWLALLVDSALNVVAAILYFKAISLADLSLTVPLVTFTPIFLLVTSPILVGEIPTASDVAGIFAIVGGSYLLNIKVYREGYLAPLKALLSQPGPKYMLCVAGIWGLTANFDKIGVLNSTPTLWGIALYCAIAIGILPIMLVKARHQLQQIPQYFWALLPAGIFNGSTILLQMQALNLALVAQVVSVKRTSVLITVLLGALLFKEVGLRERAAGAILMISGVILIAR